MASPLLEGELGPRVLGLARALDGGAHVLGRRAVELADRLEVEFNAPSELLSAPYEAIRLTDSHSARRLREIGGIRIMQRGEGELVALFESKYRLQRIEGDEPDLVLEHILAG